MEPIVPLRSAEIAWRKTFFSASLAAAAAALPACSQAPPPPAFAPVEIAALEVHPRDLPLALEYAAQLHGVREVEVRARVLPLYDQKLASLRDRDNAVAGFETSQAAVASAEAALRSAELNLSYTDVRAPIAGLTSREVRSEGSLVTAGDDSSLLAYLVQADRLYVDVELAEGDAELVRAAHAANAGAVRVRVIDARGAAIGPPATIEYISPRVDETTGTVAVRAVLDNSGSALLPGRVVRARVEGVSVQSSLVVPKRALMHGAQGPFVWVIGAGEQVAQRPVELGTSSGNDVAVASGLTAGERVIVDGILKVQPGAVVNATMLAADGAPLPPPDASASLPRDASAQ